MKSRILLAGVTAALACAAAPALATTIDGALTFPDSGSFNFYDAPGSEFGSGNVTGPLAVTVASWTEFTQVFSVTLLSADFTPTSLQLVDSLFVVPTGPASHDAWTQTFTASTPGFFQGLTLAGGDMPALTYGVVGDILTVNFAGTTSALALGESRYTANFTFGAATIPEPATWATMIVGLGLTGAAVRARRRAMGKDMLARAC